MVDKIELTPQTIREQIARVKADLEPLEKVASVANAAAKEISKAITAANDKYYEEIQRLANELQEKVSSLKADEREAIRARQAANASKAELEEMLRLLQEQLNKLIQEESEKTAWQELWNEFALYFEDGVWAKLDDYQREDIMATVKAYRDGQPGLLNMNGMGFGKTAEAAVALQIIKSEFEAKNGRLPRILWLTKKSLLESSHDEISQWAPDFRAAFIPPGIPADQREMYAQLVVQNNAMLITNYESVRTTNAIRDFDWDIVIMDEVHKVKGGAAAKKTEVFLQTADIVEKSDFKLMLSGTPAQNNWDEVFPYMHMFDPITFPSLKAFKNHFASGWYGNGELDINKILKALEGRVIRQPADRIERPDKTYNQINLTMGEDQLRLYQEIEFGLKLKFKALAEAEPDKQLNLTSVLQMLIRLRQVSVDPGIISATDLEGNELKLSTNESIKVDQVCEMADAFRNEGENVVVWSSQFNGVLRRLESELTAQGHKVGLLIGGTKNPRELEQRFQRNELNVLLCNQGYAGEGFNFQKTNTWPGGARHAIRLDRWYNPAKNEQADDRIWRRNSSQGVFIHQLHIPDTVDDFILDIVNGKIADLEGIREDPEGRFKPVGEWIKDFFGD